MAVKYDDDYWRDFIDEVHSGKSVREVCLERGVARQTFYNRLREAPHLRTLLDGVLVDNADRWAERADETILELRAGKITHQQAKVTVDHYHWRAERANPERYGAKGQITHKGAGTSFIEALENASKRRVPEQPRELIRNTEEIFVPRGAAEAEEPAEQ